MQVIRRRKTDGLVLTLTDENYIQVGDVDIHLKEIKVSGINGGKRAVALQFVGPRSTTIKRRNK